jgi:hypothetical protein
VFKVNRHPIISALILAKQRRYSKHYSRLNEEIHVLPAPEDCLNPQTKKCGFLPFVGISAEIVKSVFISLKTSIVTISYSLWKMDGSVVRHAAE